MADIVSWHKDGMLAFDLETTGIDVFEDRIVTASLIQLDGTKGKAATVKHDWIVNPGVDIPEGATKVHGITNERAQAEGRTPREAIAEINAHLERARANGIPVVGYNLGYDLTLLRAESERHGLTPAETPLVIDGFVIDKHVDKFRKGGRKLTDVAAHYGVPFDNAHDADADSMASARVMYRMAEKYPAQLQIPLAELHEKQRGWAAEQAQSFQNYKRSKDSDPSLTIPPQWPHRVPTDDPDANNSPYNTAAKTDAASSSAGPRVPTEYTMRDGLYAIEDEDGKTRLYKIDKPKTGRWAGRTFLKEQIGGGEENVRGAAADAILAEIDKDPLAATVRYGHATGNCGRCNRPLTDPASVAAGIGPVCATR